MRFLQRIRLLFETPQDDRSITGDPLFMTKQAYDEFGRSLYAMADEFYSSKDFSNMLNCDLLLLYQWAHGIPSLRDITIDGVGSIVFNHESAPLPAGLIGRTAQNANNLRLKEDDLEERFHNLCAPMPQKFPLMPMRATDQIWPKVWNSLDPALASGTTRRPRKQVEH